MSTSTDSPRKDGSNINDFKHAAPIPILSSPHRRRASMSSSSDGSPTSPQSVQTPNSLTLAPSSPTNSSFFSYFTSTSPKSSASFPYRRPPGFGPPPVFEGRSQSGSAVIDGTTEVLNRSLTDEDGQEIEVCNTSHHQRRATTTWTGNTRTTAQRVAPVAPPVIEEQHARGAGVLRRLSLGGGLNSVRSAILARNLSLRNQQNFFPGPFPRHLQQHASFTPSTDHSASFCCDTAHISWFCDESE